MSQIAKFFLLVVTPILAMLLALLGFETLPANPLGWFLALVGVVYTAGIFRYSVRIGPQFARLACQSGAFSSSSVDGF